MHRSHYVAIVDKFEDFVNCTSHGEEASTEIGNWILQPLIEGKISVCATVTVFTESE
jgi:hypothetical protein